MAVFCPLASGSKGNSLYLASRSTKLLIDAGISMRQLVLRLAEIGQKLEEIDAIVITHEHTDHVQGLSVLADKLGIPILANSDTAKAIAEQTGRRFPFKIFTTGEGFTFGDIALHPFSIQHDTVDPVAFTAHLEGIKVGICADLGFATSLVKTHLQECDVLYLESNHEPSMVHACSRPMSYKQRVLSRQGHLSNEQAAELLLDVLHPKLKKIYLAHLSSECNHPEVALKAAREALEKGGLETDLVVAYQEKVSELIHL